MIQPEVRQDGATLHDSFHAATVSELRSNSPARRLGGLINQRWLFPHHGSIDLAKDSLRLGSWRTLSPRDIAHVSMDFLAEYNRTAAGGARGGFPSFGTFKKLGAPLVLDLRTGERIALLIGYTWWSGATKNKDWLPVLQRFTEKYDVSQ